MDNNRLEISLTQFAVIPEFKGNAGIQIIPEHHISTTLSLGVQTNSHKRLELRILTTYFVGRAASRYPSCGRIAVCCHHDLDNTSFAHIDIYAVLHLDITLRPLVIEPVHFRYALTTCLRPAGLRWLVRVLIVILARKHCSENLLGPVTRITQLHRSYIVS